MKVVVLAGGSGTRLWPYSRRSFPKQFLHFGNEQTLLQKTCLRCAKLVSFSDILLVTQQEYVILVEQQLKEIDPGMSSRVLVEPERRNTAPAISLAVSYLLSQGYDQDELLLIVPSDHLITPESGFCSVMSSAFKEAEKGRLILFGIRPTKPETGYGYVKADREGNVLEFVEKPDSQTAYGYLLSGDYLWNSGMFLFQIKAYLEELKLHSSLFAKHIEAGHATFIRDFCELPTLSIDYALMEKSKRAHVMSLEVSWSDIGCWDSVYDLLDKDENYNASMGNVCALETKNCLILANKRLVSTMGLEDLFIIETEDALLIGKKGESQKVRHLYEELQKKEYKESQESFTVHRPWGTFTVLEEGARYKIKRIVVEPLARLSLQKHYHRSEHWIVVKGCAKVLIGEEEKLIYENESIFVPKGSVHRLENPGKVRLELIEVQAGEYVGEDDIVRLEDIYQRI